MLLDTILLDTSLSPLVTTVSINGYDVCIKKAISTREKVIMIGEAINGATNSVGVNKAIARLLLETLIITNYADITLSEEDMENPFELYDKLILSGVLEAVKKHIDKNELELLNELFVAQTNMAATYVNTFQALFEEIVDVIPGWLEKLQSMLSGLDTEQITNLMAIAKDNGFNIQGQ